MKVSMNEASLQIYYPEHGHTIDNLAAYLPKKQILFGGCVIKSEDAENLGYTQEADFKYINMLFPDKNNWEEQI